MTRACYLSCNHLTHFPLHWIHLADLSHLGLIVKTDKNIKSSFQYNVNGYACTFSFPIRVQSEEINQILFGTWLNENKNLTAFFIAILSSWSLTICNVKNSSSSYSFLPPGFPREYYWRISCSWHQGRKKKNLVIQVTSTKLDQDDVCPLHALNSAFPQRIEYTHWKNQVQLPNEFKLLSDHREEIWLLFCPSTSIKDY